MLFAKLYQIFVKINHEILESANIYEVSKFAWDYSGVLHISGIIWPSE